MKIFVTGGSGFIGRNLVKALCGQGHEVVVLIRREKQRKIFKALPVSFVQGEVETFESTWLEGVDAVFHLAAIRTEWGFSSEEYRRVNILGTKKILAAAVKNRVKHFVYCSTVFVFGYPRKLPIDESFEYAPASRYAASKVQAEKLVKRYFLKFNLPVTIIRPTIVYGADDETGMLLKLARLIKRGIFPILGSGQNWLHLTHIEDLIAGFLLALAKGGEGETYIIASGKPLRLSRLCHLIAAKMGKTLPPIKIPLFLAYSAGLMMEKIFLAGLAAKIAFFRREPLITRSKVDIIACSQWVSAEKAARKLGFRAKHGEQSILDTVTEFEKRNYL